jgi:glutamate dehydrogenase
MDGSIGPGGLSIDTLVKAFARALGRPGATELDRIEHAFLEQALEDYQADETPELSPEDFAAVLAEFWRFGEVKTAPEPMIRHRRAQGADGRTLNYDLLEIVQPDGPFLVDSVMGELGEQGVSVRAMFHPVLTLERNSDGRRRPLGASERESTILVVVDPIGEEKAEAVVAGVRETLADVRLAVADRQAMIDLMDRAIAELQSNAPGVDPAALAEDMAFLKWLRDDHFVFLGARIYEYPRTMDGSYAAEAPLSPSEQGLGTLRDPNRPVLRRASEPAVLTRQLKRQLDLAQPVTVAKANARTRVHRRAHMDFVGVRRFGSDAKPSGEFRFVGLFTAEAYDRSPRDIPMLRRKVARVLERAGKPEGSHNYKRLKHILETYPRDELFQSSEEEICAIALGVLHLEDRPRVKSFTRRDALDRFVSVLFFVPRERYDAGVRERVGHILARAWGGRVSAWYPQLTDAPLVRVHYIIGVEPGDHPTPDPVALEAEITDAARTWADRFEAAVRRTDLSEQSIGALVGRWANAFPVAYQDRYSVQEALADLVEIEKTVGTANIGVRAYRLADDSARRFRFKLYRRGADPIAISDVLPILDNMGLRALEEYGYGVRPAGYADETVHVHEFLVDDPRGEKLSFADVKGPFEQAFEAVWEGRTESDGFNRLVLELGVTWRDAALIRALCKYRQQSGLDASQAVQEEALRDHPELARKLLALFAAKFDPAAEGDWKDREPQAEALCADILSALQAVSSLDHDRVLRRLTLLVRAIKRTNYYQRDEDGRPKPYISFKVASRELEDLPLPKPYREIFVWSPWVEGVHLRFGPVARGGLRWSDRRDDFRTEVLGLVKAQQVKNSVIVPVGSKGGFYPKQLPKGGAPDAVRAEAVRAYKTFLSGLLDVTDNIVPSGEVVRPPHVVAWEGDDPYLVVAADKGTATFSDIANGLAESYGFWLGDAFASGGSVGYDHKAMGITARGAWVAVQRHFRELGKDVQTEPFTVAGVGDMSGDVFGNGMLLSKAIKLVAAFDHRDIFLDPNPDPARSWQERKRLFDLQRSSWQDYDKALISAGGGVFSRSKKAIPISAEVKALLEIDVDELSPTDLMRAILKSRVELLYFGGIGTYVKAPNETDMQVGDKANDAIRVDGAELRCKVVGEGANLGFTQAGRIAFARNGGRINTDAIDNSAGVDTSDHEVNIKILTGELERAGKITREQRNSLLASMTDAVARHVLKHNYDQTLCLTLQEAGAAAEVDAHERFMLTLEAAGELDRKVESLPSSAGMNELRSAGRGLTRPELAVLIAYAKNELFKDVVASRAPEDPFFQETLATYFPEPLRAYRDEMNRHRLRREIVSTVLCNDIVNMAGPTFPARLRASADVDTAELVVGFEAARRAFRLDEGWAAVSSLDLKIPAAAQTELYQAMASALRSQTFWMAHRARRGLTVQVLVDRYRPAVDMLRIEGAALFSEFERKRAEERSLRYVALGAPREVADPVSVLLPLGPAVDIADLAEETGRRAVEVARLYYQIGDAFHFDRLRAAASGLTAPDHWERQAVRRLVEELIEEQSQLARALVKTAGRGAGSTAESAKSAIEAWIGERADMIERLGRTVDEIETGGWSFAKLTIANGMLRHLASAA